MAFTVETGSGVVGANAYAAVASLEDFLADRGIDISGLDSEAVEAALVRATDYVETRSNWIGEKASQAQGLSWPRVRAYDRGGNLWAGVPEPLFKAVCWYAHEALYGSLYPADASGAPGPTFEAGGTVTAQYPLRAETERVGPIAQSKEYAVGVVAARTLRSIPAADLLLRELTRAGGEVYRA